MFMLSSSKVLRAPAAQNRRRSYAGANLSLKVAARRPVAEIKNLRRRRQLYDKG